MYDRQESEYYRAKLKAARHVCHGWVKPRDLPSNAEIRDQIQHLARTLEGSSHADRLQEMRFEALRLMRVLQRFRPRLIGSVLTGHVRQGSDIDLHVFADRLEAVTAELDYHGLRYSTQTKAITKQGEQRIYRHVHVLDRYPFELTVYPEKMISHPFISSITGKSIEKASIAELEQFLASAYPEVSIDECVAELAERVDRFQLYESLLWPLETVRENRRYHPEGDALYHSLQVFDLAVDRLPYDEEFLLAALLHDVGKAIDPSDHVAAGLEALAGFVSERTAWLIEHHMAVHQIHERTIGARALRRLRQSESYEELLLLGECDRAGRRCGIETSDVPDALDYLRRLADFQL